MVGLILYLVWQTELPNRARACGKGALIGVIVYAAVVVLTVILMVVILPSRRRRRRIIELLLADRGDK